MVRLPSTPLVAADWLADHLGAAGLVVLDASWYLPVSGRDAHAEYLRGHIPGAGYFDLERASAPDSPLPHTFPTAAHFGAYVGSLGVRTTDAIVVYDGSGGNLSAARAWWMFRQFGHAEIALLDGGLGQWRAAGRPVEPGAVSRPPVVYQPSKAPVDLVGMPEVAGALSRGAAQVVDLRSAGRYRGTDPEPRPGLPSGHMPGAVNLPYNELVDADGRLLPLPALHARLAAAGVALDRPIIATCGSGTSACALLLALDQLGHRGARLYDGSWTEWAGSGQPIARDLDR